MHSLFPEFERIDQNTLFVIGNGFDLASGIKSSYYDFKQWLILNKRDQLINLMDIFSVINGRYGGILKKRLVNMMRIVFLSSASRMKNLIMIILHVRLLQ